MNLREQLQAAVDAWDACPEHERQRRLANGLSVPGDWYSKLAEVRESIAGTPEDPVRGCRVILAALVAEKLRITGLRWLAEADERLSAPFDPGERFTGLGSVTIGTTSDAPEWTEEQLAEWLTNSGAHRGDVAAEVAKRIFNPQPTMVVRIESKEPA